MKFLNLALFLALGALPAPSVFAQDFVTEYPPADDVTTTDDGPKPKILWSVDLAAMGSAPMGRGNGIAATTSKLFITVEDCSLLIMDRSDTDPTDSTISYNYEGGSSDTLCAYSTRGYNTRPVVYERGDGSALAIYPTGDGYVVAVNNDGTQAWKTFIFNQGPDPIGSVRLERQNLYAIVTYNTDAGGIIVWLSLVDGSINDTLGLTVPDDPITSLSSRYAVSGPNDFFHFIGRASGNLYRLNVILDSVTDGESADFEILTKLGDPVEDMYTPYFPPLISATMGDSIVNNWAHAVDNQVYGFVDDYDQFSWKKPADIEGGVGNGLLSAGADMVCYGWNSISCYNKENGDLIWERPSIKYGVLGDPDLWAESGGSSSPRTVLITNLVYGYLHSLDPENGADIWVLNCGDFEPLGIDCSSGPTDGVGAMALSPDDTVVYFPPARNYIMAAEVFIQPTPAPTMNPTTASPTKNPTPIPTTPPVGEPSTPSPTTPEPTQAPSGSPRVALSWLAIASMTVVVLAPFFVAV